MRIERSRLSVLAERLIPVDFALVAVQLVAKLTRSYLVFGNLCSLCFAYGIDVVAVVGDICSATECVAVAGASAFGQFASGVAIVEGRDRSIGSECHEAAVHRGAGVAHCAKRSTVVEGDVAVEISSHAAVACYAAAVASDVDIRHYVLYQHIAGCIAYQSTEVNALHHSSAFHKQVADGCAVKVAEETVVRFYISIIIGNGVSLAVEGAGILVGAVADHDVAGEFDVGSQIGIDVGLAIADGLCKSFEVGSCLNLCSGFHGFVGIELYQPPAAGIACCGYIVAIVVVAHLLLCQTVVGTCSHQIALNVQ